MSNDYYNHGSYPATRASGSSASMRAELDAVTTGFGLLPTITGNGSKIIAVNSGATALEAIATTGTGSGVRATSPTLVTPVLGVAAATTMTVGTGTATYGSVLKRATADQLVTSSTTLVNATNMVFSIAASEEWVATFELDVGPFIDNSGLKLAVTVPTSATLNVCASLVPDNDLSYSKRTTTGGAALDFITALVPASLNGKVSVAVWVLNSTNAGSVQLQFAQSTSVAAPSSATIRKGSFMRAERIA